MKDYSQEYQHLADNQRLLFKHSKVMADFGKVHKTTSTDGVITGKEKEMISLGVAISVRCEGCIMGHVETLVKMGATMEEIAEVVDVAISMGGGPSTVYGARALSYAEYQFNK